MAKRKISLNQLTIRLIVAFALVFGGGYVAGRAGFVLGRSDSGPIPVVRQEEGRPKEVDFSLFWQAWQIVQDKYVKPVDNQDRLYGAISGQIASLDDPFSAFLKPTENARFAEDLAGNFEGIGAELTLRNGAVTIVAPIDGSPAEKAGLRPEDIILKVGDEKVPATVEETVNIIRGPKGTTVKLTIGRGEQELTVTLTRETIEIKSITYSLKEGIAVIKAHQFSGNTLGLLDEAISRAKGEAKGIILDLRNNPGGLLEVAIAATSRFIEPGVVVIERDRQGAERIHRTLKVKERTTQPLVVIVNKGSASASEILAGAVQDSGRGKVVGETTFGKGSVQSVETLKDGSAVRITVAEWLTPKKREINKAGIKPDIEVKLTEEDVREKRDPQLDQALSLLKAS